MVRIVQCLCPARHAIMAVAYVSPSGEIAVDGVDKLREMAEKSVARGMINPWCGLCGSREWTYEDRPTRFATMDEAQPELERLEMENLYSRRHLAKYANRN